MQIQGQCAYRGSLDHPIGFQHNARLLIIASDQIPQEDGENQRDQIVRNKGNIVAGPCDDPSQKAGHPVKRPGDRITQKSGDAHDHEELRHLFLLQFISEQIHDHTEYQGNPDFACCKLHTLHFAFLPAIQYRMAKNMGAHAFGQNSINSHVLYT